MLFFVNVQCVVLVYVMCVMSSHTFSFLLINSLFKKAATGEYKGILDYTEDPIVSADIKGNTHSCVIDGTLTSITGRHVKLIAWFDNEFGYTSRMIDWLHHWKTILFN